ncbi:hypothetical protein [Streptomyces sp. WMMC940]|uniref:hypothetical protein n=1 Tax=Streptomyces sp. WMMC940 TaxID=3015153 RepID=UPI0022B6486E|nr:hypothetical protein [Streptomyces sp. WMMC940]MCZ7461593.1 hypothetical protein [Streptomyces sp. WMMC940]
MTALTWIFGGLFMGLGICFLALGGAVALDLQGRASRMDRYPLVVARLMGLGWIVVGLVVMLFGLSFVLALP